GMSMLFFSSRRRHTRCYRDWSSDVCSSDLAVVWARGLRPGALDVTVGAVGADTARTRHSLAVTAQRDLTGTLTLGELAPATRYRSEERRVGKERRPRGDASHHTTNTSQHRP